MGQAKNRGSLEQRRTEAHQAGRVKTPTVRDWHQAPSFTVPGHEPSLVTKLVHALSRGAEQLPADIDLGPVPNPYGGRWPS